MHIIKDRCKIKCIRNKFKFYSFVKISIYINIRISHYYLIFTSSLDIVKLSKSGEKNRKIIGSRRKN